ncbi:hypothetical protein [Nocardioides panacihumi]
MRKSVWLAIPGSLALAGALAVSPGPATAAGSSTAYTCTGGDIPSGSYSSITVTGMCDVVPDAVINVAGNLNVATGAFFDAQSAPSTITVGKNVTAAAGSLMGLGCQPDGVHAGHPCAIEPDGHSVITVDGNITTTDADTVLLNGITVKGNVTLTGGGGVYPWPIKNNTIGGNVTASGITPEWFGLLFNHIGGNATLTNITSTDPEDEGFASVNVVLNTIGRNLNCNGLGPRLSGGFIPGAVNVVGGKATGQCVGLVGG